MTLFILTALDALTVCTGEPARLLEGGLRIHHSCQEQGAQHLFSGSTWQARVGGGMLGFLHLAPSGASSALNLEKGRPS